MDFIYILSCQRGQGSPEIFSMWDTYEKSIIAYYNYHKKKDDSDDELRFMFLYKLPVNETFNEDRWSATKLQKSSKFRIKMTWNELKSEYKTVIRDTKIENILN